MSGQWSPQDRLKLTERMAKLPGSDSQSFFDAHDLGAAYRSPGRGSNRKAFVTAAIFAAERRGDLDEVLEAAKEYLDREAEPTTTQRGTPRPASDLHSLPSPKTLTQKALLQMIFDGLTAKGRWPTFKEIDRKFDRSYQLDIVDVAREMPPGLVAPQDLRSWNPDQELKLTIAGAAACDNSGELVGLFVDAVRLAARLESKPSLDADAASQEPTMTPEDLRDPSNRVVLPAAGRDQVLIRLGALLSAEHWGWSSSTPGELDQPTWRFTLGRGVRSLRKIESIEDYWRAVHEPNPGPILVPTNTSYAEATMVEPERPNTIFLAHGHDEARHEVARFIERSTPSAHLVVLNEQANRGRTIIEKFEEHGHAASFAVVLLTPDDLGRSQKGSDLFPRARQNVVFELGYFFGALGRDRVAVLNKGVEEPSDVDGIAYIAFPSGQWKLELARELQAAGFDVNPTNA